jgi:N-acetyl-anhydromuramyl-L-alanine amidase AmpD
MRVSLIAILCVFSTLGFSQDGKYPYQKEFSKAYNQYPAVPKGVLEAVAYTTTRINHITNATESCVGLPQVYGIMGLTLDGKGYFKDNLKYISQVSELSVVDIIKNPELNILAFAAAYSYEVEILSPFKSKVQNVAYILSKLSELPSDGLQNNYALNAHLYAVFSFMNSKQNQEKYDFINPNYDLVELFGSENLKVLESSKVFVGENEIENEEGESYAETSMKKSIDYSPAISDFTTCNFSSRAGVAISEVAIHTIQGSYAGAISWFKNCSANVSAHYVLRSSDGQVTQMVLESDKGWHVGNSNPSTIGLEHEGFVSDSSWYTAAMYQSSADLVIDITQSGYGINPLRTAYFPWAETTNYNVSSIPGSCVKIKGHQHFPMQTHTDPGANWDWKYYDNLINEPTTSISGYTTSSGNITDLGGAGNYTNDERTLQLIQPISATSIELTVNEFDVEAGWDYLYIYEGNSVYAPVIGIYDGTTIPSTININGGSVLVEFRTDCATTSAGFDIAWNAVITGVNELEEDYFNLYPNPVKDQLILQFSAVNSGSVLITDITGKLVKEKSFNSTKKLTISVNEISNGVYLLKSGSKVVKFVKE